MMKNEIVRWSALALLIMVMATGCGQSGGKTIAVVGDYEITVDEFDEYTVSIREPFATAEDEYAMKRQALDTLVVTHLLIQAAYEKKIDQLEEVARVVLANKDKFLLDAMYSRNIIDKAEVTDAEIKDFHNRLEYKVRASQILVNDPDTAQMLFERITNGGNFEQLAYEYSIDPSAKRNRGDLGYFVWGAMVDEFQEVAFSMEPGELSQPTKSLFGYHIIKCVDKTPNELRGEFEATKESIERQMLNRRRQKLMVEYLAMIAEKYPVTVDRTTCDYLMHKREQLYPPQLLKGMPKSDFDLEQLDRNERELVLASWSGGQVSVVEYLTKIRQVPQQYRPDLDDYDSLSTIVFELKKLDILAYEATVEGLDNDEQFKSKIKRFKDLAMADLMRNDSIPKPPTPDEANARRYYDEHPQEFSNPAKIHVYEILLSDELQARKLASELKSLKDFKESATVLTERPGKRASGGDLGYIERDWFPEIFDMARKTQIGGIDGPVVTGGKYSIFYVVDRTSSELKDFLGVKRQIMQTLVREQNTKAFSDWVDERKSITKIEVNDDLLWEQIDRSKYASADTASVTGN